MRGGRGDVVEVDGEGEGEADGDGVGDTDGDGDNDGDSVGDGVGSTGRDTGMPSPHDRSSPVSRWVTPSTVTSPNDTSARPDPVANQVKFLVAADAGAVGPNDILLCMLSPDIRAGKRNLTAAFARHLRTLGLTALTLSLLPRSSPEATGS